MIKHKSIGIIAALAMAVSVLLLSLGYFNPSLLESVTGSSVPPYVAALDKTQILDIQIVAGEADWAGMLESATAEEYIPATVIINGVKVENVGIRPKGNSSLSQVARDSTTNRYSFKIEFDQYVTGQAWLGLDKIVVNNMQGDSTYMKEYLSYDIMAYVGVEAPLYAFSSISVNGEAWGFYLAVEALEDSYAKRVYGNDHGKLYKPESMGARGNGQMEAFIGNMQDGNAADSEQQGDKDTAAAPERRQGGVGERGGMGGFGGGSGGATLQYTDDEFSSYSVIFDGAVFDISDNDRRSLISALEKLNAGVDLENVVDVEATLKYFAAHTVIVNLDSYISTMCHNYYLYEKDGQLTMLPWDFNLAFGGFQSGNASSVVNFPMDTPVSGVTLADRPILAKLLEVPAYMELYHGYLQEIVDGYFNSGTFEQTIHSLDTLISARVENDPSAFYTFGAYQSGVAELLKLGLLRAESLECQLDGRVPATATAQSAHPDALIDASSLSLSALGSMGGGGGGAFGGRENGARNSGGEMQNFNREAIQRAMEIVEATGGSELTEDQLSELQALGITEEQIDMFQGMGQGGFGGERPAGGQGGMGRPQGGQTAASPSSPSPVAPGYGAQPWLLLGGCTVLLLGGLLFVVFFKRRKTV